MLENIVKYLQVIIVSPGEVIAKHAGKGLEYILYKQSKSRI